LLDSLSSVNRRELSRFLKFATVGAVGAITDFSILNILIQVFGAAVGVANIFSFSAAVIQNFILNRIWTFPGSQERQAGSQLMQFALVSVVGLVINQFVFIGTHEYLLPYWYEFIEGTEMAFAVSYNFAKLFATGIVLFWNFTANRLWTYRGL